MSGRQAGTLPGPWGLAGTPGGEGCWGPGSLSGSLYPALVSGQPCLSVIYDEMGNVYALSVGSQVLDVNVHSRNLFLHVFLMYKQTTADQTSVALRTYRTRYITLEGCLFFQDCFCPILQKIGETWLFSGLFSRDLCPVCTVLMTKGCWLTFERCRYNLEHINFKCQHCVNRKASWISLLWPHSITSCRMGSVLNFVGTWMACRNHSAWVEWNNKTHPKQLIVPV